MLNEMSHALHFRLPLPHWTYCYRFGYCKHKVRKGVISKPIERWKLSFNIDLLGTLRVVSSPWVVGGVLLERGGPLAVPAHTSAFLQGCTQAFPGVEHHTAL